MNSTFSLTNVLSSRRATGLLLTVILALAGIIRLWIAFSGKTTWYNTDTYIYLDMARGILNGHPVSQSPNGYPLIIALLEAVLGIRVLPAALIGLNVFFAVLTVLLCNGIGSMMDVRGTGLVAAVLMAIWPNQINYMRQILTETPSTFFLVLGFWLIVRQRYAPGGVFIYVAALIRSTLLPVTVLILFWMILFRKRKADIAFYTAGLTVVFLMNLVLVKLHVVEPPLNVGDNLLIAIQPEGANGVDFRTDSFTPEQKAHPLETYLAAFAASPGTFVSQRVNSLWELWGPWPKAGDAHMRRSVIARLMIGMRFPLVLLALVEVWRRRESAHHWLMVVPIFALAVVHVAFFSTPRFSYCAEPFAIVLCAILVAHIYRQCVYKLRNPAMPSDVV